MDECMTLADFFMKCGFVFSSDVGYDYMNPINFRFTEVLVKSYVDFRKHIMIVESNDSPSDHRIYRLYYNIYSKKDYKEMRDTRNFGLGEGEGKCSVEIYDPSDFLLFVTLGYYDECEEFIESFRKAIKTFEDTLSSQEKERLSRLCRKMRSELNRYLNGLDA